MHTHPSRPNPPHIYTAVDHGAGDLPVFESGAVPLYLAERDPERRLLPPDPRGRAEALSWLFWQMVGRGVGNHEQILQKICGYDGEWGCVPP